MPGKIILNFHPLTHIINNSHGEVMKPRNIASLTERRATVMPEAGSSSALGAHEHGASETLVAFYTPPI